MFSVNPRRAASISARASASSPRACRFQARQVQRLRGVVQSQSDHARRRVDGLVRPFKSVRQIVRPSQASSWAGFSASVRSKETSARWQSPTVC